MALVADPFITIVATGVNLAAGAATSAVTAIPNMQNGKVPVKVRVSSTAAAHIRFGIAGVVATANDTMVQPGDQTWFRIPVGIINFAVIQDTVAGNVNVTPCEDA